MTLTLCEGCPLASSWQPACDAFGGRLRLSPDGTIWCRGAKAGTLSRQTAKLLRVLMVCAGELVPTKVVFAALWNDMRVVNDPSSSLRAQLCNLRDALKRARAPVQIVTQKGMGLRLELITEKAHA